MMATYHPISLEAQDRARLIQDAGQAFCIMTDFIRSAAVSIKDYNAAEIRLQQCAEELWLHYHFSIAQLVAQLIVEQVTVMSQHGPTTCFWSGGEGCKRCSDKERKRKDG